MGRIIKTFLSAALLSLPVYFVLAQFTPAPLALSSTPQSPSPGETVTIEANTPTLDKDRLFFEWTVDGKNRSDLSGLGKNLIKLAAGTVGSSLRIVVSISGADREIKPASLVINVSDLSLVWFAETYVPRWYKGKALPTQSSIVRVVAVPKIIIGGAALRPESLIYSWSLDDEENALSGIGEQVFRFKMSDFPKTTQQIEIMVEDSERIIRKKGRILLTATAPEVKIYASSPLGGVEFRSGPFFTFTTLRGLLDFVVEPFFFAVSSRKNLSYRWQIASEEVQGTPDNPYLLTVDTTGQVAGTIPISVTVDDANDIIPSALNTLSLILQ